MKRLLPVLSLSIIAACGTADDRGHDAAAKVQTSSSAVAVKADAAVTATAVSAGAATRHLPGTLITTATGKYYYLVKSDQTVAPFASSAIAVASGYALKQAIVVSVDELDCYGRGDQITAAMPAPSGGQLRDGTLVKEEGKSAVYAVSDAVAWPIMNQAAFDLAGYDAANVATVSAGSLAKKVAAVGDCSAGLACLDSAYLLSCAENEAVSGDSGTATSTAASTATSTAAGGVSATQRAGEGIRRHLPGTVIASGAGSYYLVNGDGTISPFASADLALASGYKPNMIIAVSSAEMACYGLGDPIAAAVPAPSGGRLRDGTIAKEAGKTDVFVVSGGVAWPVVTGAVFESAGYTFDATVFLPSGGLAAKVLSVGDCAKGVNCLTADYGARCGGSGEGDADENPVPASTATATKTQTAVSVGYPDAGIAEAGALPDAASAPDIDARRADAAADSVGASSAVSADAAAAAKADSSVQAIDLAWVYGAFGSQLCLNAAYFAGSDEAVLLIWEGPGADGRQGPVALLSGGRFCWNFANREKGLYRFWADAPGPDCADDICPRDAVPGNGGMYMTAPKATAAAKKWLYCQNTGCDGLAYWDGTVLSPAGG